MRFDHVCGPPEFRENFCKPRSAPMLLFRQTAEQPHRAPRAEHCAANTGPQCKLPRLQHRCSPFRSRARIPIPGPFCVPVFRTNPSANRNACRQLRPHAAGRFVLQSMFLYRSAFERRKLRPTRMSRTEFLKSARASVACDRSVLTVAKLCIREPLLQRGPYWLCSYPPLARHPRSSAKFLHFFGLQAQKISLYTPPAETVVSLSLAVPEKSVTEHQFP